MGDSPTAVLENRRRLASSVVTPLDGVPDDPAEWVWLRQVHGRSVAVVDSPPATPPEADAAVTTTPGLPLVVLTADCAPIALAAPGAVGVVHAGWPGLEQGVIGEAVAALRATTGGPVRAVLGPCVHPADYEFGPDLLERLVAVLGAEVVGTTRDGSPALDVPTAVRVSLSRAGVDDVVDLGISTAASSDHFSHRRDGVTGRQGVVVVRTP